MTCGPIVMVFLARSLRRTWHRYVTWFSRGWLLLAVVAYLVVYLVACRGQNLPAPTASSIAPSTITSGNDRCIANYDPNQDYFPDKSQFDQAASVKVTYHKHYKVVTVKNAWAEDSPAIDYALVQCGTPNPPGFEVTQIIQVPVETIVTLSTTYLPPLEKLGLVDRLVGISDAKLTSSPQVLKALQGGKLKEVSTNDTVNTEQLIALNPALVMSYELGGSGTAKNRKLLEAGLKVAINADYTETSPLGRSEWLKFVALFFNQEATANQVFTDIAQAYQALVAQVQQTSDRPTVFTGFDINGTWYMPGGSSYMARYLKDAGANYLWADSPAINSLPLSLEVVLERASSADFWLNVNQAWMTRGDILAADPRYENFVALGKGQLFNNNAQVNANGGNDYWEGGLLNPHIILKDLIKIFHPNLLPDHQLVYYRKIA